VTACFSSYSVIIRPHTNVNRIMFKLNSACVVIRSVKSMFSQETSRILNFSYILSLIQKVAGSIPAGVIGIFH